MLKSSAGSSFSLSSLAATSGTAFVHSKDRPRSSDAEKEASTLLNQHSFIWEKVTLPAWADTIIETGAFDTWTGATASTTRVSCCLASMVSSRARRWSLASNTGCFPCLPGGKGASLDGQYASTEGFQRKGNLSWAICVWMALERVPRSIGLDLASAD